MKSFFFLTLSLLATDKTFAQFMPPFLPLNGLFATSALRNEMRKYRIKTMRAAEVGGKASSNFPNPSGEDISLEHAHECAEHFGKCSVQELEGMRDALHAERLRNELIGNVGAKGTLDPVETLDHLLLEEDLSLQLALLKDEMGTIPPPLFRPTTVEVRTKKKMEQFSPVSKGSAFVPPGVGGGAVLPTADDAIRSFIADREQVLLLQNGVVEAAVVVLALIIIAMVPSILQV